MQNIRTTLSPLLGSGPVGAGPSANHTEKESLTVAYAHQLHRNFPTFFSYIGTRVHSRMKTSGYYRYSLPTRESLPCVPPEVPCAGWGAFSFTILRIFSWTCLGQSLCRGLFSPPYVVLFYSFQFFPISFVSIFRWILFSFLEHFN